MAYTKPSWIFLICCTIYSFYYSSFNWFLVIGPYLCCLLLFVIQPAMSLVINPINRDAKLALSLFSCNSLFAISRLSNIFSSTLIYGLALLLSCLTRSPIIRVFSYFVKIGIVLCKLSTIILSLFLITLDNNLISSIFLLKHSWWFFKIYSSLSSLSNFCKNSSESFNSYPSRLK